MSEPLRLLILTDTPLAASGGSERFLRNLIAGLPANRYAVTVIQLCHEPQQHERVEERHFAAIRTSRYLPFGALYGVAGLRAYKTVRRLVTKDGFHIIQSQHEKSDVFNALLPRGAGRAVRISNRRDTGFLKSPRLRKLFRILNGRYDCIVAPAKAILEAARQDESASSERMRCIRNGVDTERFHPASAMDRSEMRRRLGFSDDEFLIGTIAAMTPVKRHGDLLTAFCRVLRACPRARMLLIGDGPLRGALEQQVVAAGIGANVCFYGTSADVASLLPALDASALVSETEGMSNTILEAMSSGLPVIATDVGGNIELVEDGRTGILVPVGDVDAITNAMLRLAADSTFARACGNAARERVLREFSLARMVSAYETLYADLRNKRHVA